MTISYPGTALSGVLHRELEVLRATANRSDPVEETVLCLVECAARAAAAAERPVDREQLHEALAAARAAVVAASFALAEMA
ncbi:hypothetical protein GCM10010174_19060 [Kutzneria viridogrisea]|uniref:Uncharacterized protein n=1 Tax=Kutzneria viridogrisea TaxID=47990 RepID=A0ABR6B859_9PSEU|nr:hypothetical protein [Kutzneria viridogrisea]